MAWSAENGRELGGEPLSTAYEAIMAWSAANGRELSGEPRERYLTDPGAEPDPAKWLTAGHLAPEVGPRRPH